MAAEEPGPTGHRSVPAVHGGPGRRPRGGRSAWGADPVRGDRRATGHQPRRGPGPGAVPGRCLHPARRLPDRGVRRAAARAVPGHGAGPPVRPGGQRPATAGSAEHLGSAARPGGGADRRRPGDAAEGHGLSVLPRTRRRLVSRRRSDAAAGHLPRHRPLRVGPEGDPVQQLHDRHRQPGAQRHRLRHGSTVRRRDRRDARAGGHQRGDHRLLR